MKFLAITLLAVCLIQGNNAQLAGLRGLFNNAQNAVSGAAANVASAASGALNNAVSTATNIRNSLPGGAQALIDSAAADISVDSLTEAASSLSSKDLMQTVQGAAAEVAARVEGIQSHLEQAVNNVTQSAEATITAATSSWNSPVQAAVQKALAAGVDVKDCAVDGVANLAKESVTSAVKCVTDKVKEAITLTKNIAGLPVRAATLAKDGVAAHRECGKKSGFAKKKCQLTDVAPVAVKSVLLVKDTVSYTTQATTLVTTIQSQLTACATKVAATSGLKAASTGKDIISCVAGKMKN